MKGECGVWSLKCGVCRRNKQDQVRLSRENGEEQMKCNRWRCMLGIWARVSQRGSTRSERRLSDEKRTAREVVEELLGTRKGVDRG